jgi:hypothetical protein
MKDWSRDNRPTVVSERTEMRKGGKGRESAGREDGECGDWPIIKIQNKANKRQQDR